VAALIRQLAAHVGAVGQEPGHRREQHEAGDEGPHARPDRRRSAAGRRDHGARRLRLGRPHGLGRRHGPASGGPSGPVWRRAFVSPRGAGVLASLRTDAALRLLSEVFGRRRETRPHRLAREHDVGSGDQPAQV
jgi:hypothetical protein